MSPLFEVPRHWVKPKRCPVCGCAVSRVASATYAAQRQGWVKIGASSNPAERISVLGMPSLGCQVRAPEGMDWAEPIILLGVWPEDIEHLAHERFAHLHAAGEWFRPDAELVDWTRRLMSLADAGLPTKRVGKPWVKKPEPVPVPTLEVALW